MTKPLLRKTKSLTILVLILAFTISLSFTLKAKAETTIISITPTLGYVGTTVQLTANISTVNGTYEIWFDEVFLTSGNATETYVDASFAVPPSTAGDHTVKITDTNATESDTEMFTVLTFYSLEVFPKIDPPAQRQEGDQIQIFLNITGGDRIGTTANITVQTPDNSSYATFLDVTIAEDGSGNITIKYPMDFAVGANTNFVGEYEIFFNTTLATESFFMWLTNSTEYHRNQLVDIKAVYKPEENVTLAITGKDVYHSVNLTADDAGTIRYTSWAVPSNASIGTYTINITSMSQDPNATIKDPPDIQNFTVPGFAINVTARNLAEEPVPDVTIKAFENETSVANATSGSDGLASLKLETGNYTSKAYFKGENVGEGWINITDAASLDFYCNLTNLRILVIAVADETEILMPEVEIYLTPENQTQTTDITGTAVAHSLLPNVTYGLNASRYGMQFNVTTIPQLLVDETAIAWYNVTITCPMLTLQIKVTNPNANGQPISNAMVKVQELMGGMYREGNTDVNGTITFNFVFGKYKVEVYDENGTKLTEITSELFENKSIHISCSLYGLTIWIKVVDYFGQPIPNANVILQREGLAPRSGDTQSDGTAIFGSITGGSLQIAVYLFDQAQPCAAKSFFADSSTTIEIRVEKYVLLAGVLVETSQLITTIIIAAAVILILSIEVYRRKRSKPQKGES